MRFSGVIRFGRIHYDVEEQMMGVEAKKPKITLILLRTVLRNQNLLPQPF
jgi:hypothetical protein